MKIMPAVRLVLMLFASWVLAGCSTAHYRKSADQAATSLIAEKAPLVPNMDPHFTIEQTNVLSLDDLPVATEPEEAFGPDAEMEVGARVLSLAKALEIGVKHSRIYQTQREQCFCRPWR
jgi:hypothetical protein